MKRFVVPMLVALCLCGCVIKTSKVKDILPLKDYGDRLRNALVALQTQQKTSAVDWKKANDAKKQAFAEPKLTFQNPKTQEFIRRWRVAESQVIELRKKNGEVAKTAEELFNASHEKANSIKTASLRSKMDSLVSEQERKFHVKVSATSSKIAEVESRIEKGNDLIKALEIAGTLQTVQQMGDSDISLPSLQETVSDLCKEGETLLKSELSALK